MRRRHAKCDTCGLSHLVTLGIIHYDQQFGRLFDSARNVSPKAWLAVATDNHDVDLDVNSCIDYGTVGDDS